MDYTLGVACCTRCEIKHHRVGSKGIYPFKFIVCFLHSLCEVFKAFHISLYTPGLCCHFRIFKGLGYLFGHFVLRCAYNSLYLSCLKAVYKVADRKHMCRRYHNRSQLMQSYSRKPVFIMAFQNKHNFVALCYACIFEYIGHFIAVFLYIGKCKDVFLIFGIAPYDGSFFGSLIGYGVHNIISKIEIVGIVKGNTF